MNLKQKFNSLKQHKHFKELMKFAKNLSYKDVAYSKRLVSKRDIRHYNDGNGWATDVTAASYEINYSYDLQVTKKYYKQIVNKNYSYDLLCMLEDDLLHYERLNFEIEPVKKYLYSDIKLMIDFCLCEIIGDFYLIKNLYNDEILTINKKDIIFNDLIYKFFLDYSIKKVCSYIYFLMTLFIYEVIIKVNSFLSIKLFTKNLSPP